MHLIEAKASGGAGPRAMLKHQRYKEIATQEMHMNRKKISEAQNDSPYEQLESITQSAQADARNRLVRSSCLDVSSEEDLKSIGQQLDHAVTFWSHELKNVEKPHFPVTPLKRGSPLFAKNTSFTNDITDSRVRHSEAHESVNE